MTDVKTSEKSSTVRRTFDAPRERVWEAWTEPDRFQVIVTFDEREGDATELTMRSRYESAAQRERSVEEFGAIEGAKQTLGRLADHLTNGEVA